MRAGKVVLTVVGAVIAMMGLVIGAAGAGLLGADAGLRTADGFLVGPDLALEDAGHAIASEPIRLDLYPGDVVPGLSDVDVRITVTPVGGDQELFLGIAQEGDVAAYLDGVAHARVVEGETVGRSLVVRHEPGGAPTTAPTDEAFWEASVTGPGEQTLTWEVERGTWTIVVMNADAAPGIAVTTTPALRTDAVVPLGWALVVGGVLTLAVAALLLVLGLRDDTGPRPPMTPPDDHRSAGGSVVLDGQPVTVGAELDSRLSRWRWLIKWALAIPHVVVLAVLWPVFLVLTIVAGVSILFTGRYPPSIFDVNVGIMRWTWRVTHYAYGVLGTDRYPPFSLAPDPSYPADLDVERPQQLSRGLVLVKSWLLALPHLIIVGVLTGGLVDWTYVTATDEVVRVGDGGGLIALLAVVAGGVLLFTGRYPRGLFDLLVGLHRWVYRVVAYVALMTDHYPPFRLDMGGSEPGPPSTTPPVQPAPEMAHAGQGG